MSEELEGGGHAITAGCERCALGCPVRGEELTVMGVTGTRAVCPKSEVGRSARPAAGDARAHLACVDWDGP